jgi:aryl-alcohol dehydrogenase-like predicted oxidoreductase
VPGFKNLRQLEENVGAVQFGPLSRQQMAEVASLLVSDQ